MTTYSRSKGEDGSVLVLALILLVLLTMLGIAATMTTEIETRIAGNENAYKKNLYRAEGAAMTGVQMLEDVTDASSLKNLTPVWLHSTLPGSDINSDINWNPTNNNSIQALDATHRYLAVYQGIAPGGSLDIGGSPTSLHQFTVYGRSGRDSGASIVEVGFKKRF